MLVFRSSKSAGLRRFPQTFAQIAGYTQLMRPLSLASPSRATQLPKIFQRGSTPLPASSFRGRGNVPQAAVVAASAATGVPVGPILNVFATIGEAISPSSEFSSSLFAGILGR